MAGKKNKWQKGLLFFLFFFLAQTAWAQLSVSIEPQNPVHEIALYSNEVADFKLLVINLSSERIVGQQFQLLASEGIVLLEQNQEKKNQSFLVPELLPDQAIELFFVIKAKESGESVLSVNFGNYVFSDLVAKRIRIVPSLLQVSVQLENNVLRQGQIAKGFASFQNNSLETFQNIRSELMVSHRADSLTPAIEILELLPNQIQENVLFEFWPKPLATGDHEVHLQTIFVDSNGMHTLDHLVGVQVQEEGRPFIWLIVIIVFFLIIYLAWRNVLSKPPVLLHDYARLREEKQKEQAKTSKKEP